MYFLFVSVYSLLLIAFFFFFNDTATTEIYTLSLHDALPISEDVEVEGQRDRSTRDDGQVRHGRLPLHPGGAGRPGARRAPGRGADRGLPQLRQQALERRPSRALESRRLRRSAGRQDTGRSGRPLDREPPGCDDRRGADEPAPLSLQRRGVGGVPVPVARGLRLGSRDREGGALSR